MHCPKCKHDDTKVLDTRVGKNNLSIRRRRQCLSCSYRFSTVEDIVRDDITVIKRDGRREEFEPKKIVMSLQRATEKRSITSTEIDMRANQVIEALCEKFGPEITSSDIGIEVMHVLKQFDSMAYLRFASVCKAFNHVSELANEISSLNTEARP